MAASMNNRDGAGILQDVFDLRRGEPRVDRHHDRPRSTGNFRVHQLEIAVAVERQDGDPVAAPDAPGRPARRRPGPPGRRSACQGPPSGGRQAVEGPAGWVWDARRSPWVSANIAGMLGGGSFARQGGSW